MKAFILKTSLVLAMAGTTGLGMLGCGSASNDQGVSFTFMGWFAEIDEEGNLLPLEYECGGAVPQITDFTVPLAYAFGEGALGSGSWPWGELALWAGGLNNLQGQTIRVDKINMSYHIPGAINQPPDTASALGIVLGPPPALPATNSPQIPDNSSLPIDPATSPLCFQGYDFTPLLPTAVKEWMNFHRDEIPEAPFRLVVTSQLSGVTSAGDRLYSNELAFGITVTPDNPIFPGGAAEDVGGDKAGGGSGGTSASGGQGGGNSSSSDDGDGDEQGSSSDEEAEDEEAE